MSEEFNEKGAEALEEEKQSKKEVKGEKLDNQPYDLAVEVNDDDSEEFESEEEDEVNQMNERNV